MRSLRKDRLPGTSAQLARSALSKALIVTVRCRPVDVFKRIKSRHICNSTDYVATASDDGVLKLNPRTDLTAEEIANVFGYARDLKTKVGSGAMHGPAYMHARNLLDIGANTMPPYIFPGCSINWEKLSGPEALESSESASR